jgi:hypothetical protein
MGKKLLIYFAGLVTGVILASGVFAYLTSTNKQNEDGINYFETPISYENKKSTSFEVFQVFGNAALAKEVSNKNYSWYNGKTVLLLNGQFYCDQVVEVEYPKQVGTYSYQTKEKEVLGTTVGGDMKTVPVIDINQ